MALDPPTPEDIAKYRADGSLETRAARARALGNDHVDPALVDRARAFFEARRAGPCLSEKPTALPPGRKGMPTKGVVNVPVLLISFPEYPPFNGADSVRDRMFGSPSTGFPYESVHNFYSRSSYGQLDIQGAVLGWYATSQPRSDVAETVGGREKLLKEALEYYDSIGHDFSVYDNDGDGAIDYLVVIWTGPRQEWADFWWGYQTHFSDESFLLDGKRLLDYSWQWEARDYPDAFAANTVIHETGHALGLPDYYDYDANVGPGGGVGGLDQMDAAILDHNCFSKFLLDWISPTFLDASLRQRVALRPSGTFQDAAVVMPEAEQGDPFGECFMIQNRSRTGNDINLPGAGLVVWHVDGRLDDWGWSFRFNNSYTDHKLLRLMEADGLEEIERRIPANAGDFYRGGSAFGPSTAPSSDRYDGTPTGISLSGISLSLLGAAFDFSNTFADTTPPTGAPSAPLPGSNPVEKPEIVYTWTPGTAVDNESGIVGFEAEIRSVPDGHVVFFEYVGDTLSASTRNVVDGNTYTARVRTLNGIGLRGAWSPDGPTAAVALTPLCEALGQCGLVWTSSGFAHWFGQRDAHPSQSDYAARSGFVRDGSFSVLETAVSGPCVVWFYWKVSSEEDFDFLGFLVDGVVSLSISGEADWSLATARVPFGSHTLSWRYKKDPAVAAGMDAGFLSGVGFAPLGDVDGSGRLTAVDLATLHHALAGNILPGVHPFSSPEPVGDMDGDGHLDADDLVLLSQTMSGAGVD